MRLTVSTLRHVVKRDLPLEFVAEDLTSYSGLELLRQYVRKIDLGGRIRRALTRHGVDGDYGSFRLVLLVVALFITGARRLEHVRFLSSDPLIRRFSGLARIPTERTVVHWLKRFTQRAVRALGSVATELVYDQIERLRLRRLTIDVDGTVVRTGTQVAWAMRGFNPRHPKDPSYYPVAAHLAETGQLLRVKNRPGNVNDARGAVAFIREIVAELRGHFGRSRRLDFRMDAAFFQENVLKLLPRLDLGFAIKVPFWKWLKLKDVVARQKTWTRILPGIEAFETTLPVEPWDLELRVVIYRKRVHHRTPKNFQLDLFSPDDGTFEYSAITSNLPLGPRALWEFAAGRGAQEKTFGELKNEFAFDVVPTNHYGANSAWQQLSVLAHNLVRSFQLDTAIADKKSRSRKRTYTHRLLSMKTLRFLLVAKAGRVARIDGRRCLRIQKNPATQKLYQRVSNALVA